jgi:diacylglycerol kinase (ATP)
MRKAFLIYNPASGRRRAKRKQDIARVVEVLRAADVETETCATTHIGSAIQQVQAALGRGFDTVISCGGDGTANEALNGVRPGTAV